MTNETKIPTLKAQAHGLKFDGKMYKCSVSYGQMRSGAREFTIYGTGYYCSLPQVDGWECNTDSQTDYFEHDKIRVKKGTPLYRAWIGELRRKRNIDRARYRAQEHKRQAKSAARRGLTFTPKNPFHTWLEKNAHYAALIAAKKAREAKEATFAGTQAETLARMVVEAYKANQPPVLTIPPRPARCAPATWAFSTITPTCRPAAWQFAKVAK